MRTSKRIIVSIEILLRHIIIIEQISIIKKENLFIKKYIQQEISVEKFTREKVKITKDRYSSRDHHQLMVSRGTINHKIRREVRMLDPCTNRELEWLRASFRSGSRAATHKSSNHAICTVRSVRSPPRKQTSTSNLHIISTPAFV